MTQFTGRAIAATEAPPEADATLSTIHYRIKAMRKMQQGFTLIELVVVITVLGILAAFAIPRFASLDAAARVSATNGLAGSIRSASALAHSLSIIAGTSAAATGTVTMENTTVNIAYGYPTAAATGITAALNDTTGFTATGSGPLVYQLNGLSTCQVSYTAATATTAPVITATTSAC